MQLRPATTHSDQRGDLCEIYDERWGFTEDAAPFVYAVTVNLPSRPYQHADPDKYRVLIDSEVVPYRM